MAVDYKVWLQSSNRNLLLMWAGAAAFVLVLFWFFVLTPQSAEASTLEQRLKDLQARVAAANDRVRSFKPPDMQELQARAELDSRLHERVPPIARVPELVQLLVQLAQKNALAEIVATTKDPVVPNLAPPSNAPRPYVASQKAPTELERLLGASGLTDVSAVPVDLSFRGDHAQFGRFLLNLQELKQFVELEKITIRRAVPKAEAKIALRIYCQAPLPRAPISKSSNPPPAASVPVPVGSHVNQ